MVRAARSVAYHYSRRCIVVEGMGMVKVGEDVDRIAVEVAVHSSEEGSSLAGVGTAEGGLHILRDNLVLGIQTFLL